MLLSIIIPAYNEEMRIVASLEYALNYYKTQDYDFEIIVVDDGSSDATADAASNIDDKIRVVKQPKNMGKGAAVRCGMLEAKGDIKLFSDADFSTPAYETNKLLDCIQNGNDICIGSRAVDDNLIKKHQPFYREFMGKTFNKFVQLLLVKGIKDTQCGFKAFTKKSAKVIFEKAKINGFGFDTELLYLAKKKRL